MPLDPISNDLEARITVASKMKEDIYSHVCKNIMCYHTLDALVIQALRSHWICDPTTPWWFEWFFAEKPPKSSATAYKHKDCSDAIGYQIKQPRSSYHRSIQAVIAPYVFSHGRV